MVSGADYMKKLVHFWLTQVFQNRDRAENIFCILRRKNLSGP